MDKLKDRAERIGKLYLEGSQAMRELVGLVMLGKVDEHYPRRRPRNGR